MAEACCLLFYLLVQAGLTRNVRFLSMYICLFFNRAGVEELGEESLFSPVCG